jgi:hypothetical protein
MKIFRSFSKSLFASSGPGVNFENLYPSIAVSSSSINH